MKTKLSLVCSALVLMVLLTLFSGCADAGNKVAVISLRGSITFSGASFLLGQVINPDQVKELLERAERDVGVKAIVVRVESPGGTVAACQEILNAMEKVTKPIVISMGETAASGGYYISAKADKIVALPGTLTGSIGVISQIPNIQGLYDKLGIKIDTFKGGKYKDMYSGIRELTEEEKGIMQGLTDLYYDQFVKVVAEGRNLDENRVRELATGQLYAGVQAKELGLVDKLGGLQAAIDTASDLAGIKQPRVEYYRPRPSSFLESFFGLDLRQLSSLIQLRILGPEGVILYEILNQPYPEPRYQLPVGGFQSSLWGW